MITGLSMYRLISASLLGLLLIALIFGSVGLIGYQPAGIAVTAVLAIGATMIASFIGARLVKTTAHLESSVITGLLIAFIVPPTLETRDLIGVSLAGLFAGVSKYVIVWKSRHVLNPAATGVLITTLTGLSASFWWVANPPMTPFLLATGLLIAWRSSVLLIAMIGLGVGATLLVLRLALSGEELLSSTYLVLTSYPIVFLSLFMLTEPLTLPARRLARVAVAVLVGVGVALPWSLELGGFTLYTSPELALILGNLLAFGVTLATGSTRAARVTLQRSERFGSKGLITHWELERPLSFQAGQWVELHLPHRSSDHRGERRIFSVVSSPSLARSEKPTVSIATTLAVPGSSFKRALVDAEPGLAARITTVGGDFVIPRTTSQPLAFIAGGIGITPFISHLEDLRDQGQNLDIVLIEVRSPDMAHPFEEVIAAGSVRHICIERTELEQTLRDESLRLTERECYLSGSPAFLTSVTKLLREQGITRFHTDSFTGY